MIRPTAMTTMPRLRALTAMRDREHALSVVRLHSDDIAKNGNLELRYERGRTPSYCLRFYVKCPETGAVRQRRLSIGDDTELHDIVRPAIVARVRQRMLTKAARSEAAKQREKARTAEAEFMAEHPGSRRYRQTIRRAYRDSVATGEDFLVAMLSILADRPPRKRPGRPVKNSRLW